MSYFSRKAGREVCGVINAKGDPCWRIPNHASSAGHLGPKTIRREEAAAMERQRKRRKTARAYIVDGRYRDRAAIEKAKERYAGPD